MIKGYNILLDPNGRIYEIVAYTGNPSFLEQRWQLCKTHEDFINYIATRYNDTCEFPENVSVEHDLVPFHSWIYHTSNGKSFDYSLTIEPTGLHSIAWLLNFCISNDIKIPKIHIHSKNTVGAKNIKDLVDSTIKRLTIEPETLWEKKI